MIEMLPILVVDDDQGVLAILKIMLERGGFQSKGAPNAERAIELLKSENFRMVITDSIMPGKDGVELIKIIRGTEKIANLPILYLHVGDQAYAQRALEAGADDCLSKPFLHPTFLAKVHEVLDSR
jgi:two-component system OmpR family response regulator